VSAGEHAAALVERGYCRLPAGYALDAVSALRAALVERYRALGEPETWANPPLEPARGVEISKVGLVFHQLGLHVPEHADAIVAPSILEVVRASLGPRAFLEYTSAVLCRGDRPFFPWHMHVGGVDNVHYRKQALFPRFSRPERLTLLVYLDALTVDEGRLLVCPRRIDEATEPPEHPDEPAWRNALELDCGRGEAVLMEQNVWHAALPKRTVGSRVFVACYFTSPEAKPTSWVDRSLLPYAKPGGALADLLAFSPPPS
jgi:hypothetical protein